MLLAICTTQVKKEKRKKNNKVTKNLLQRDSNPDAPNQLEVTVDASVHWTTSVSAYKANLKEVYKVFQKFVPIFSSLKFH